MRKTYKYRLYPTKKQIVKLERTFDTCRILYNSCLLDRRNHYKQSNKSLSRTDQQVILKDDKKRLVFLKDIHSQVLQDVLFRVDKAFQSFFRRVKAGEKPGYPRFKSEGRYSSITYPQEPAFQITEQGLKLSKIGTIKIKLHRTICGQIKSCNVKKDADRWYVCFSVEYEPIQRPVPLKSIGIDVGIKSFAVTSDGEVVDNPKYLRKSEKKLIYKQRELSMKKKGSANRKKARKAVAKIHSKIRDQRSDFHHKVSRKIVNTYGFIAVEDLNIKGMVKNHHLAKSISDAGWGQFLKFLTYKAEEAGCKIEKVSPHYTSIICSVCGEKVTKTLADRIHDCPFCKTVLDRDHNAAINILYRAGTAQINAWGEVVQKRPLVEPGSSFLSLIGWGSSLFASQTIGFLPLVFCVLFIFVFVTNVNASAIVNLGKVGAVYHIAEPDALQEIIARAERLDMSKYFNKEKLVSMIDKFSPKGLFPLPSAKRDRAFFVDLTYTLDFDITDGKGKVIFPKGFTFNPLDYVSYPKTLVVINSTVHQELEWFKESIFYNDYTVKLLITSGVPFRLMKEIKRPVFFATKQIIERFSIISTPSVIRQQGNLMVVREFKVNLDSKPKTLEAKDNYDAKK